MQWQNEAERYIQEVKKMINTIMDCTGCPNQLWIMCSLYVVYLFNRLAKADLNWRSSHEICTGVTPDISALLIFSFYEQVYYLESETPFLTQERKLDGSLALQKMLEML